MATPGKGWLVKLLTYCHFKPVIADLDILKWLIWQVLFGLHAEKRRYADWSL
jgi:hypothetical protein